MMYVVDKILKIWACVVFDLVSVVTFVDLRFLIS